jgi:hypothetical protein
VGLVLMFEVLQKVQNASYFCLVHICEHLEVVTCSEKYPSHTFPYPCSVFKVCCNFCVQNLHEFLFTFTVNCTGEKICILELEWDLTKICRIPKGFGSVFKLWTCLRFI